MLSALSGVDHALNMAEALKKQFLGEVYKFQTNIIKI